MGDALETIPGGNLLFNLPRKALVNFDNFRAFRANQMVMVTILIFTDKFETTRSVTKIEALYHAHFFEQMHGAINRRQIASFPAFAHLSLNFLVGKRMGMTSQNPEDRRARTGDFMGLAAQTLFQVCQIRLPVRI